MKLTSVAPYRNPTRSADVSTFDCACGYRLTETLERRDEARWRSA
jgi:hypothetical protein